MLLFLIIFEIVDCENNDSLVYRSLIQCIVINEENPWLNYCIKDKAFNKPYSEFFFYI